MIRRSVLRLAAVGLAVAIAGCIDSTALFSTGGTYRLETVDGMALPFLLSQSGLNTLSVESGELELYSDFTFRDRVTFEIRENGVRRTQVDVIEGTWKEESSGNVTFTTATLGSYSAGFGGRSLTLTTNAWAGGPHTLVYVK